MEPLKLNSSGQQSSAHQTKAFQILNYKLQTESMKKFENVNNCTEVKGHRTTTLSSLCVFFPF